MSRRFDTLATLPQLLEIIAEETPDFTTLLDAATDRRVTARQFVDSNRAWARASAAAGVIEGATSVPWTLNGGYYRNPEATAEAWRNGWFHTGDALMKDAEGNFCFIDRNKDCIRRKGENISSFEVEAYALEYPGVAEAAAIGVASDDGEQEVKIFIVAEQHQSLDLNAMGAWLGERMPRFMIPRYLEILPEFPKTPVTGRVQKGVLRSRAPGAFVWDRQSAELDTPLRRALPF